MKLDRMVPISSLRTSRRALLGISVGTAAGLALPSWAQNAQILTERQVGTDGAAKFYVDGRVRPFPGNTIVCHLPQQGSDSAAFSIMLDIYREAPWRPYGRRIAFLPPSSYHMTIIGGATDNIRETGKWPAGIPGETPIEECNRIVGERIRAAKLERLCEIRMTVDASNSGYDGNTIRIPLKPIDGEEFDRVEGYRSALADAIGIPRPVRGSYQFHMTLGYLLRSLTNSELEQVLADLATWKDRFASVTPIIRFGTPEYCIFDDMFAFERQFFVGAQS